MSVQPTQAEAPQAPRATIARRATARAELRLARRHERRVRRLYAAGGVVFLVMLLVVTVVVLDLVR